MAKSEQKIKARELRKKGVSVRTIARQVGVSRSTASLWVRDIILSVEQLESIRKVWIKGTELGRLKGAMIQKQRRIALEKKYDDQALIDLKSLTKNELLVSGLCLYWGEGSKRKKEMSWCNSDPNLMNFMIDWLRKCYGISQDRFIATLGINEIHKKREDAVKKYWSEILGIPLSQFRKTSFKKVKLHKIYDNFDNHYGTLRIRVLKPGDLWYKIMAQIKALSVLGQRSSVVEQSFHKTKVTGPNPVVGTL